MTRGSKSFFASAISLLVFPGIGLVMGILHIIVVGEILGRGGDGFGLVAAIVVFPVLTALAGLGWLVLWHLHAWKPGPMGISP